MLRLRMGISLANLRLPFRMALSKAAELGADAVEVDSRHGVRPREMSQTAIRDLKPLLEYYDLKVSAVSFRTRRGYNIEQDLDQRAHGDQISNKAAIRATSWSSARHRGNRSAKSRQPF